MRRRTIGKIAALGLVAASAVGGTAAMAADGPNPYAPGAFQARATATADGSKYADLIVKVYHVPAGCDVKVDVNNRHVRLEDSNGDGYIEETFRVKAGAGAHLVNVKTVGCDDRKETKASFSVGGVDDNGVLSPDDATPAPGQPVRFSVSEFPEKVNLSVIVYDDTGKAIRNRTLSTDENGMKTFIQTFRGAGRTYLIAVTGGGTYAYATVTVTGGGSP